MTNLYAVAIQCTKTKAVANTVLNIESLSEAEDIASKMNKSLTLKNRTYIAVKQQGKFEVVAMADAIN